MVRLTKTFIRYEVNYYIIGYKKYSYNKDVNNMMKGILTAVIAKITGTVLCLIGIGVWYTDYLVFSAIGALCKHLALLVGITGEASVGVMIIGWVIGFGLMVTIFVIGGSIVAFGAAMFLEGW